MMDIATKITYVREVGNEMKSSVEVSAEMKCAMQEAAEMIYAMEVVTQVKSALNKNHP